MGKEKPGYTLQIESKVEGDFSIYMDHHVCNRRCEVEVGPKIVQVYITLLCNHLRAHK